MTLRDVLRKLVPRPSPKTEIPEARPSCQPPQVAYIWEGVYPDFASVPARGKGHSDASYVEAAARGTKAAGLPYDEYVLFPLLAAAWFARHGWVSVLDIGGRDGLGYIHFRNSAPSCDGLRWHVVETPEVCRAGRRMFPNNEVTFSETIPQKGELGPFDLVQVMSTLHYVEDYRGMVAQLCAVGAALIYVLKEPAGDFPTFATAQRNLGDTLTPCWFFNRRELIDLFAGHEYELHYHGLHDREYDTTNFPPERRWRKASHFLFGKAGR
jgi:putative methyltransferase (TIGR04325 family)